MANIVPVASQSTKKRVIENSWNYILENFHKFNEHNKIKIALAVIGKDMPTKLEGELETRVTQMGKVTIDDVPLEPKIGD